MTPPPDTQPREEAVLPDRIWIERDADTGEKRWFSIPGMGVEYVRAPAAGGVDAGAQRLFEARFPDDNWERQTESVKDIWRRCAERLSSAPTSGSEAGGEAVGWTTPALLDALKAGKDIRVWAEKLDSDVPVFATPAPSPAGGVREACRPHEMIAVIRDAFLAGRGLKDGDKLSDADRAAWVKYDPTRLEAYRRWAEALSPATAARGGMEEDER